MATLAILTDEKDAHPWIRVGACYPQVTGHVQEVKDHGTNKSLIP